jgi:hypothetical protein
MNNKPDDTIREKAKQAGELLKQSRQEEKQSLVQRMLTSARESVRSVKKRNKEKPLSEWVEPTAIAMFSATKAAASKAGKGFKPTQTPKTATSRQEPIKNSEQQDEVVRKKTKERNWGRLRK